MGFYRLGDLRVQLLPGIAQQTAVRGVLHQRMLKAIDCLRRRTALEDQFGGGEPSGAACSSSSRREETARSSV